MYDPFKFFSQEKLQSLPSAIVGVITEDLLQIIAEEDCGGRLSDDELAAFSSLCRELCYDHVFHHWVGETIRFCLRSRT